MQWVEKEKEENSSFFLVNIECTEYSTIVPQGTFNTKHLNI